MKILVTGGAGYIGSVLSSYLNEKGHDVRIFDKFLYGKPEIKGVSFFEGDILEKGDVGKSMEGMDAVVHLAAIVGGPAGDIWPEKSIKTNRDGTKMIVRASRENRIENFVLASTCSVYGRSEYIRTESSPPNPLSGYARTKLEAERVILHEGDFESAILRLGTSFGLSPRMRFDLGPNKMIGEALWDGKIYVPGDGSSTRPIVHVLDVAEFIEVVLKKGLGGIYNVASFNRTMAELAKEISKAAGGVDIVEVGEGDGRDYKVSTHKAEAAGFKGKRSISGAVKEIRKAKESGKIEDYRQRDYSNAESLKKEK